LLHEYVVDFMMGVSDLDFQKQVTEEEPLGLKGSLVDGKFVD